eukprot:TRINITY_DN344_c0_g1_i1.p1 TRINITY_DN344_c0_g1~~TRINITY_DN344_c0_g1_i1.p1  ORF type:complete len:562 (+),score=72.02 TRINITY_DN344_c0_g1_i1:23-1708(+)
MSQPLLPTSTPSQEAQGSSWVHKLFLALIFCVLIVILGFTVDNRVKLQDQRDDLSSLLSHMKSGPAGSAIISKFKLPHVGPRKYQYSRGTCWNFGAIACVEYSYRSQGIEKGWLKEDEYLLLSEQAYGNRIIELCQQHRMQCLLPGDRVAFNSTEGGEAHLLYTFAKELSTSLLPISVCPYIKDKDDSSCPGIEEAIAVNPLKWTMNGFTTYYGIEEIKKALATNKRAMGISVPIFSNSYYIQCSDLSMKTDPACYKEGVLRDDCTPCPVSFKDKCCKEIDQPMWNMMGEFKKHHALNPEAGHLMMLVGYNDMYETEDGLKGGLVMRNTWMDGVYAVDEFGSIRNRGSHSLPFFMQEISLADERYVCPNVDDPRSWYTCGACSNCTDQQTVAACANKDTTDTADALYQPFFLTCRPGQTECKADSYIQYFTMSMVNYGDDMRVMCFMEMDMRPATPLAIRQLCLDPRPYDAYSRVFKPVNSWPNREEFCGYYFFPYELGREAAAKLGSFFASDYDVTFSDQSYAANAASHADRDYFHIQNSTGIQPSFPHFSTPYPLPDLL